MKWKEFLRPDLRKITIFIIIFGFPFLVLYPMWTSFPLQIAPILCADPGGCFAQYTLINYYSLIIDLGLWYVFSCLIVWIYDKVKKK